MFQHPSYNVGPGSYPNDISIVVLASNANLANPLIATIPMATSGQNHEGTRGTISGWGYTTPGGSEYSVGPLNKLKIQKVYKKWHS